MEKDKKPSSSPSINGNYFQEVTSFLEHLGVSRKELSEYSSALIIILALEENIHKDITKCNHIEISGNFQEY